MPVLTLKPVPYRPSSPLAGNEADAIIVGRNAVMRGTAPQVVYEAYPGSENLGENYAGVPLTGTVSFTAGTTSVTGTNFYEELHIGQKLLTAGGEVLSVAEIISDTEFRNGRPLQTSAINEAASRGQRLFPLDVNRGVQLWGNAAQFDKGTIVSVGDGVLYRNGAALPGTSLTATRNAQVAVYDSTTGNYTPQALGFDVTPIAPSVAILAAGGSKNMSLGYYSFRVAYYSETTDGYGNPTDVILGGANAPFQLTVANSLWEMDFTADVANRPTNADGYVIYQSAFSGSSAISAVNAIQGGWFEATRVLFSDLDGSDKITFEAVDSDLTTLVTFDNNPPPDAEFIAQLDSYVILLSCRGPGVGVDPARVVETSPGPFIAPMKAANIDGYPATLSVPTEKGETIIGAVAASGRIFAMTANTLQAVSSTGLPSAPMIVRPFWRRGFASPDNLTFIDDTLYGFTTRGPYRSIATGDSASESNDFASDVETEMASWNASYVYVVGDTTAEEVCYIYSASRQNDQGYWETDILPYSLQQRAWMPPIVLSDPTRDMIVTGAAQINGYLEFIAGGRRAGDTERWDTWRYNTGSGSDVDCFLAWQYTDNGAEMLAKWISKLRPKGKFENGATLDIYTVSADGDIDLADLAAGTNATFSYVLDASGAFVRQYPIKKCRVRQGLTWTARLGWTSNWDGASLKDQIHEIAVSLTAWGQER